MHMLFDEIRATIDFLEFYQKNQSQAIVNYYLEQGAEPLPLVMDEEIQNIILQNISFELKEVIDFFIHRMTNINKEIVVNGKREFSASGIHFRMEPVSSCGIYVPYRFVTSLITWVTAAKAASVDRIVVYLPIDKNSRLPCPACLYAAKKLGAIPYSGPARFAFPLLAFGCFGVLSPVDVICGPAGYRLNIIKQLSATLSGARTDFFAGPSDLTVILGDSVWTSQAILDLEAQLEHGEDSKGNLIIIGDGIDIPSNLNKAIRCIYVKNLSAACKMVNELSPETVELYGIDSEVAIKEIKNFGVLYYNLPSSMGDYMIIGRGCGDPTNGSARSNEGISPFSFLRYQTIVKQAMIQPQAIEYGKLLTAFENMPLHKEAFAKWDENRPLMK